MESCFFNSLIVRADNPLLTKVIQVISLDELM